MESAIIARRDQIVLEIKQAVWRMIEPVGGSKRDLERRRDIFNTYFRLTFRRDTKINFDIRLSTAHSDEEVRKLTADAIDMSFRRVRMSLLKAAKRDNDARHPEFAEFRRERRQVILETQQPVQENLDLVAEEGALFDAMLLVAFAGQEDNGQPLYRRCVNPELRGTLRHMAQ
jgi:hypothetical protein